MIEFEYTNTTASHVHIEHAAVSNINDAYDLIAHFNRLGFNGMYRYKFKRMLLPLTKQQLNQGSLVYSGNVKRLVNYQ